METPALDYFKYAAQAFGAVARPTIKAPGVNENGFFLGGVQPVVKKKVVPPKPQPMPGSGSTDYKIGAVGAMLRPTAALLNPTATGARGFMPGAVNHLQVTKPKNVQPEHAADVPGSVGIASPKTASALAYFAMLRN